MTTDIFIGLANKKFPHLDYSETVYKSSLLKIEFKCPIHGIMKQDPYTHLNSEFGCPACGRKEKSKNRLNSRLFKLKEEVKYIHGGKYNYLWNTFKGMGKYMTIICPEHGNFEQTPSSHLFGRECPICGHTKQGIERRLGREECIKRFREANGYRYNYDLVPDEILTEDYISVVCPKHGIFKVSVANHLRGSGCPACQESHGEKKIRKILMDLGIPFHSQYVFKDCSYIAPLRFDFYLPDFNMVIEYQGQQHYMPSDRFGGQKAFEETKIRDRIKKEFCLNNNINFEEIRYDQDIDKCMTKSINQFHNFVK